MKVYLQLDIHMDVPEEEIDEYVKKVQKNVLAIEEVSSTDVMDVLY